MATFIVAAVVAALVGVIIWKMVRDRRGGKSPCGCDCAHCHAACSARPK